MKIIGSAAAVLALIATIAGGVTAMDMRHVSAQQWQIQERQTLEWRVDETLANIARTQDPRERGRLESTLDRLLRELCSKYPDSYLCH